MQSFNILYLGSFLSLIYSHLHKKAVLASNRAAVTTAVDVKNVSLFRYVRCTYEIHCRAFVCSLPRYTIHMYLPVKYTMYVRTTKLKHFCKSTHNDSVSGNEIRIIDVYVRRDTTDSRQTGHCHRTVIPVVWWRWRS